MGQRPDEIRADIEATRRGMDRTLDEIEDRVSPRRIAERRTERVRSGWARVRESVMGSPDPYGPDGWADRARGAAEGASERVRSSADSAMDTVREAPQAARRQAEGNPLAAGLIAFGAGLLAASVLPRTEAEGRAADELSERIEPLREQAATVGRELAEQAKGRAQEAVEATKETAAEAAEAVKEEAQGSAQAVRGEAGERATHVVDEARNRAQTASEHASDS
jgi:hypothetical protein